MRCQVSRSPRCVGGARKCRPSRAGAGPSPVCSFQLLMEDCQDSSAAPSVSSLPLGCPAHPHPCPPPRGTPVAGVLTLTRLPFRSPPPSTSLMQRAPSQVCDAVTCGGPAPLLMKYLCKEKQILVPPPPPSVMTGDIFGTGFGLRF